MRLVAHEKGDTLIEVLMAVVTLALVVTICYSVMTQGFAQGQVSLERTTTQGMLAGQLSIMRDLFNRHEAASSSGSPQPAEWTDMLTHVTDIDDVTSDLNNARTACTIGGSKQAFYFKADDVSTPIQPLGFLSAKTKRQATFPTYGDGMWLEGYRVAPGPGSDAQPYYIFFAKACWNAAISNELQSMVTNVRFYEAYN